MTLRNRIALYATISSIVALAAWAATTWVLLRYVETRFFDRRVRTDADELFRDLENFTREPRERRTQITERFVPLALRDRYIELLGAAREPLYRSPNLGGQALSDAPAGFSSRVLHGRNVRVGVFEHGELILYVGAELSDVERLGRDLAIAFLAALPVVAGLIAFGGRIVGLRALQPMVEITRVAEQITAERLDRRLPLPAARDELHRLAVALNRTFERLERSFGQAVRFSADASHQLKTPLTLLRVGLDALLRSPRCDSAEKDTVNELLDQVRRLTSLTEDLLLLARADAGRLELRRARCDLRPTFDDCLDDARTHAESRGIVLEVDLPPKVEVEADGGRVGIILQNLLENSVKYNRDGGRVRVCANVSPPWLEATVGNTGESIPRERQAHIFERFFRGQSDERIPGTGLGLSLAQELARAHGGDLELTESAADWTEFRLRLPLAGR
ncbi:MAG: HAMP domain-containing sensor histidine kinase [Chthoniobacteraceae bacterium]